MDGSNRTVKVLLVGYNGANNTGSEARLLAIIAEARSVLGPEAIITVPTLNERNLRRYIKEDERLRIAPIPSIYFFALRRLIREHDLIMLIEGSCYMDTWAKALLWAYLSTSKYSRQYGKPCLAYAVDAGTLSKSSVAKVRREASKTDLIVTRTHLAAARLREWGVSAPITVTEDTAFTFDAGEERGTLERLWPGAGKVAGMAVVDFHVWPVVIRPFGSSEDCYRWPYYFSRSPERRRGSEELASCLAKEADRIIEEHGRRVALIAMEAVD
jgi:polysaccharide pyruvyl transferase WcaK-like protein